MTDLAKPLKRALSASMNSPRHIPKSRMITGRSPSTSQNSIALSIHTIEHSSVVSASTANQRMLTDVEVILFAKCRISAAVNMNDRRIQ